MKDEAMKLALEELAVRFGEGWHEGIKIDASDIMLLNNAAQALAQTQEPVSDDIASILACRDMLDAQPVPPRTWIGLEGAEAGWFCHTDFLNARKYTKKQREYICNQLLSEAQSWDIDQYIRMMHDSTKRPFIGLTDEDMYVVSEEESCSFIAGAKWSEAILKDKNT